METGYPKQEAQRKQKDAMLLKGIHDISKISLTELLPQVDLALVKSTLTRENVYHYIMEHGKYEELKLLLKHYKNI